MRKWILDVGQMDYSYTIKDVKLGDKFFESEYGQTIYGEVITEPKIENDYLSFLAKMSDGRNVTYGGNLQTSAYWPDIIKIEHWPESPAPNHERR